MEDLKQIISENSKDGENITLEEIKALDKQELAKTLNEIDSEIQQKLKNGLKNLIKNTLPNIKNLQDNSENNQIILYAMQIYGNLCGMKMLIDGKYNPSLISPGFKNLFLSKSPEKQDQKTSLGEKFGIKIESLKDAKNINELLDVTLETLIKNYAKKLNSSEGISFKTQDIYRDLVSVLQEIDSKLPEKNILKGNISLIIQNFLTPKENGEKLIQSSLDKILGKEKKEVTPSDIDSIKIVLKGGIGTIIDIAKNKDNVELNAYIKEIKNIPKLKEYIDKIPEFDKIFDFIISLSKTLDKKELLALIDNFFAKNTQNLLKISNLKHGEKLDDKLKLEIVNGSWQIIDSLMTKDRIKVGMQKISQFDFLKNNPLISQAIDIINNSKLTDDDKFKLFKEISNLVLQTTNPDVKDENIQSNSIKESLNKIINSISTFNKEGKIDEATTVKFLKQFFSMILDKIGAKMQEKDDRSFYEKAKDMWSGTSEYYKQGGIKEILNLFKTNSGFLETFINSSLTGNDGLEEAIKESLRNHKLSDNILDAGGNLISRMEKAFKMDSADMILSMRNAILSKDIPKLDIQLPKLTSDIQKAAYDMGSIFVDRISKKGQDLIISKLNSANDKNKNLTKQEIIDTVFAGIQEVFQDKDLRKSIFENAKKLGVPVGDKEQFIQKIIGDFLSNPEFKNIINNIIGTVLSRVSSSKDVGAEFQNIKKDFNNLIGDFTKNYKNEGIKGVLKTVDQTTLIDGKTKKDVLKTGMDFAYNYFKSPENLALILESFPEIKQKLPPDLDEKTLLNLSNIIFESIPKEKLQALVLSNIDFIDEAISGNLDKNKAIDFASKFYKEIPADKRLELLENIAKLGKGIEGNSSFKIDENNAKSLTDMLYLTLETKNPEKLKEILGGLSPILQEILDKKLFGNNNMENIFSVLESIPKAKFENFLKTHTKEINNAILTRNENQIGKLALELSLEIDMNKFKTSLDKNKLSQNESALLDMSGSVQESLSKNQSKFDDLARIGNKFKKHFESGEKDISKSGISKEEITKFASICFDIINDTLDMEIRKMIQKEGILNKDDARKKLAEKFEMPQTKGEGNIETSKIFTEFLKNNFGFLLSWAPSYLLQGKEVTVKNAGIDYFLDKGKKEDFINIVNGYFG